ncbi:hypothetical protein BG261_04065 [Floricoccus tropicus]|uniref:Acyltransferase 3 domain-containing protein n=1 Tax=Floricoccus tropicus TaxID=1859473 RepID=A0A1E8GLW6_9LACT|nr:acyltransferase family protein [Floricoccus tropicus]OFI49254.1 hypothetical protein BG261_04065 [Floricoccus tropicus]
MNKNNSKIKWFSLIRILGLILVLFYHFFKNVLPGGFIGVDIFFVFSGYLITSLVVKEIGEKGSFSLLDFYRRRFLRIFPPLLIMVLFTLPLSMLLPSDYRANIGNQAMAALGFVTNLFEIRSGSSYESQFFPHFYVHTWTLSLEFLFYLLGGFFFFILYKIIKKRSKNKLSDENQFKLIIMLVSLIGAIISIVILELKFNLANPSVTYYSASSHFYPFFIGSLTATLCGIKLTRSQQRIFAKKNKSIPIIFMFVLSVVLVIMARLLTFDNPLTFRIGLIATSLVTALLIVNARILSAVTTAKEPKVLGFLADISYSMYLWHWPLWIVISYFIKNELAAGLLSLVLTTVISAIVYYGIEPWFHGKNLEHLNKYWQDKRIRYGVIGVLAILLIGDITIGTTAKPISDLETSVYNGELVQTSNKIKELGTAGIQMDTIFNSIYASSDFNSPLTGLVSDEEIVEKNIKYADYTIASSDIRGGVTLIGDSVMLGAAQELSDTIPGAVVDAKVSRNYQAGYEVFENLLNTGKLGKYVVIGLGTNPMGGAEGDYINSIIQDLPNGSRLVFIVPYNAKNPTDTLMNTQEFIRDAAKKYDFVTAYEWPTDAQNYVSELEDGVHLIYGKNLKRVYTSGLIKALNSAASKPAKK